MVKVVLLGGTSHTGKSTTAQQLAQELGWNYISTDQLARHPGRPWREEGSQVPEDVQQYFANRDDQTLLTDVLEQYQDNVWPIAVAVIRSHLNNDFEPSLVMEGSAILPELVHKARLPRVFSAWLTGPNELISNRIKSESNYMDRAPAERQLIDTFTRRSIGFANALLPEVKDLNCRRIELDSNTTSAQIVDQLVRELRP